MLDMGTLLRSPYDLKYSKNRGMLERDMTALLMVVRIHERCLTEMQRGANR